MKAVLAALLLIPAVALGQATVAVPRLLPYQGRLLKTDGTPEAGSPRLTFCVYGAATGGGPLWCEQQTVPLRNGFYAVFLGAATPFDAGLFDGNARWLGVAVEAAAEMTPRQQIASVAYAITATYSLQAGSAASTRDAQHAAEADHAASATVATSAVHATSADTATRVPSADYATAAGTALSATTAQRATIADRATTAETANTFTGEQALTDRVTALERPAAVKAAFGYVSPEGVLLRNGPSGGIGVTITHAGPGTYQINGAGIGDGVLLVTREMSGAYALGDDIYVRVQVDGADQFTVFFNANDSGMHDVGWFFHIMVP